MLAAKSCHGPRSLMYPAYTKIAPRTIRSTTTTTGRILLLEKVIHVAFKERIAAPFAPRLLLQLIGDDHGRGGVDMGPLSQIVIALHFGEHRRVVDQRLHFFRLVGRQHGGDG